MKREKHKALRRAAELGGIAAAAAACDQLIKRRIRRAAVGAVLWRGPGLMIVRAENRGMAFGLLAKGGYLRVLAVILAAALLPALLWARRRAFVRSRPERFAFALLLGGAAGNMLDRLLLGTVTDYVRMTAVSFPVFNLADVCITGGVSLLALRILRERDEG